jgi:hypothetical protein
MLSSLNLLIAAGVSVVAIISYSSISAIFNAKVQESVSLKLEESSETVSKLNSDLYELSKQLVLNNTEIALKNVELPLVHCLIDLQKGLKPWKHRLLHCKVQGYIWIF